MQKQKINKTLYLALQTNYEYIQVALYDKEQLIHKADINKINASRDLVLTIDELLKKNNLSLQDLTFLAVNNGPCPFTTLRVVIVTANALNFAGNLPLIGINGLEALIKEYANPEFPITVTLLNAYNKDVYYSIQNHNEPIKTGWQNIIVLLNNLKSDFKDKKIRIIGNGATLFHNEIKNILDDNFYVPEPNPQTCSIEAVAKEGYQNWINKNNIESQLTPIYLKDAIKL